MARGPLPAVPFPPQCVPLFFFPLPFVPPPSGPPNFGALGVVHPVVCRVSASWVIFQPSAVFDSMKASMPQWLQVEPRRKSYRAQTTATSPSIITCGS
ncbi:MAG TPA: hypothetical protein VF862_14165 [Gemmatimonadales bacterium]